MSTKVVPAEYRTLTMVPEKNWNIWPGRPIGAPCDVHPDLTMRYFMQTPDHRAIALCQKCYRQVLDAQRSA